jgi:hypothetical protein
VDRQDFLSDFKYVARFIFQGFFPIEGVDGMHIWFFVNGLVLLLCLCFICFAILHILKGKKSNLDAKISEYGFVIILAGPAALLSWTVLLIQGAFPFTRVFSFWGVFLTLQMSLFLYLLSLLAGKLSCKSNKRINSKWFCLAFLPVCACWFFILLSPKYMEEYSFRDYYALDAIKQLDFSKISTYLASDIYAKQQFEFHYVVVVVAGQAMPVVFDNIAPEAAVIHKALIDEAGHGDWAYLFSLDELPQELIQKKYLVYENEQYYTYQY